MIMEENSLHIENPFGYSFGQDFVKEDLSELNTIKVFAKGECQDESQFTREYPFNVLKDFPYSKKILTKYFHKFVSRFYERDIDFKITTSWAVKLKRGDAVHHHNHRNCLWSCVFYYGEYTPRSCPLRFQNPIGATIPVCIFDESRRNPMMSDIAIAPQSNMLLIFPSWIYHFSDPNMEETRYSLAFNLMPSGEIGGGDSTYHPRMMIDTKSSKGFG